VVAAHQSNAQHDLGHAAHTSRVVVPLSGSPGDR
jgi:hypothetical protein